MLVCNMHSMAELLDQWQNCWINGRTDSDKVKKPGETKGFVKT